MEKIPIQTTIWVSLHVVFLYWLAKRDGVGAQFIPLFTQPISPKYISDKRSICSYKFTPL